MSCMYIGLLSLRRPFCWPSMPGKWNAKAGIDEFRLVLNVNPRENGGYGNRAKTPGYHPLRE